MPTTTETIRVLKTYDPIPWRNSVHYSEIDFDLWYKNLWHMMNTKVKEIEGEK
jgi:hypothetical protein